MLLIKCLPLEDITLFITTINMAFYIINVNHRKVQYPIILIR